MLAFIQQTGFSRSIEKLIMKSNRVSEVGGVVLFCYEQQSHDNQELRFLSHVSNVSGRAVLCAGQHSCRVNVLFSPAGD